MFHDINFLDAYKQKYGAEFNRCPDENVAFKKEIHINSKKSKC